MSTPLELVIHIGAVLLRLRNINGGIEILVQPVLGHTTHDTHNLLESFTIFDLVFHHQPLPDRVLLGEETTGHRLVDDDHSRCLDHILLCEHTARQKGDSHGAKIPGSYG